jgi:hypothetical protein
MPARSSTNLPVTCTVLVVICMAVAYGGASTAISQWNSLEFSGLSSTSVQSDSSQIDNQTTGNAIQSLMPSTEAQGTVLAAYSEISADGVSTANFTNVSTVSADISTVFATLSNNSTFISLARSLGSSAFRFQVGNMLTTGVTHAYFSFQDDRGSRSNTTTWDANLVSGALSGPVKVSTPKAMATTYDSGNWAGWQTWVPGNPTPTLDGLVYDSVYPTISTLSTSPQNVPSGTTMHQVAAVWAGLTDNAAGGNNFLQDGFSTDATNTAWASGTPWYEAVCSGCPGTWSVFSGFTTNPVAGDSIGSMVKWSGANGYWLMKDTDFTTNLYGLQNLSIVGWLPHGIHPQWGLEIVEAFQYSGVDQQIAKFSQVNFYDITICPSRDQSSCSYADNATSGSIFQLDQACSSLVLYICYAHNLNTNQNWNYAYGGVWNEYEYPDVTWDNSNYDYDCIYNGQYSGTCI